jgi:hypothetical protein
MNLSTTIELYNINHVHFCEPIKNNIIENSKFIKVMYSDSNIILNGIYLNISLKKCKTEAYYNKIKCSFDLKENIHILQHMKTIEEQILRKINILDKKPLFLLQNQVYNQSLKLINNQIQINKYYEQIHFILKISGIWEDSTQYGLTFKFIFIY